MDIKATNTKESGDDERKIFPDEISSISESPQDLENIFNSEPQVVPSVQPSSQTAEIIQQLGQIQEYLKPLSGQIVEVNAEIKQTKIEQRVLTEMHDRCRDLGEQYYQREVLGPLFRCVIGIADRCRQQADTLKGLLKKHVARDNKTAMQAIQYLLDARQADYIEIESLLANYGVEPFENPDIKFDPTTQKCISRIETPEVDLVEKVSQRLLPGYRRDKKIIRKEYVKVYVLNGKTTRLSKGASL